MKYRIDHDYHIHTFLSSCSRDPLQNAQRLLQYAKENDLLYINMLDYQEEIGIDWSVDTYDTGLHLNVYGAEKASRWFGKVLQEQCGVADRRSDAAISTAWAEKCQTYHERKARLEKEQGR